MAELTYRVGAREIVEIVSALRSGRLTQSPFFQRNLVWRETHRKEFIETILAGLPFPQIFLARGRIDVETMESFSCVVDGQQRLTAIEDYVDNKFAAAGRFYSQLTLQEKDAFLKYRVAVIDFDLEENDERLRDIFKRLNRTYYSLSTVEKIASEFSASEFLVAARVLCGDFEAQEEPEQLGGEEEDNPFLVDPSLPEATLRWAESITARNFSAVVSSDLVFSNYEAARQVPLMFVLTMMATYIFGSYFNRTDKVKEYLQVYNDVFDRRDDVVHRFHMVGETILSLRLERGSFWLRKTNFFTLVAEVSWMSRQPVDVDELRERMDIFARSAPARYILAQREAVNSRRERVLRGEYFREFVINRNDTVINNGVRSERSNAVSLDI